LKNYLINSKNIGAKEKANKFLEENKIIALNLTYILEFPRVVLPKRLSVKDERSRIPIRIALLGIPYRYLKISPTKSDFFSIFQYKLVNTFSLSLRRLILLSDCPNLEKYTKRPPFKMPITKYVNFLIESFDHFSKHLEKYTEKPFFK